MSENKEGVEQSTLQIIRQWTLLLSGLLIGAAPGVNREEEALRATARYGAKLAERDARYFFPDIETPYRR